MNIDPKRVPEAILDKKLTNGQMYFFIKWEGYDNRYNSWERCDTLQIKDSALQELENRYCKIEEQRELQVKREEESKPNGKKNPKKRLLDFSSYNNMQISLDDMYGDFECEDKPRLVKKIRKLDGVLEFIVEWQKRDSGFQPKDSVVTNKEMRRYCPDFLIDFYESRIQYQD